MFRLVALKATECDCLKVISHYAFDKGLYGDLERASDMYFFPTVGLVIVEEGIYQEIKLHNK